MRKLFDYLNLLITSIAFVSTASSLAAQTWETVELPVKLTVGYAVRAIDMNSDGKLDIAIVDSKRVLWLENPTWKEHVIHSTPDAKFDNVCFAPHDVDGDGLLDLGLGADWQPNNSTSGGTIGWLQQKPAGTWTYHPLSEEPTTHRMHFVELQPGKKSLVVAPLKGPNTKAPGFEQTAVRLLALTPPAAGDVSNKDKWTRSTLFEELHVMHNFHLTDLDHDKRVDLLCASYEGVTWLVLDEQGKVARSVRLGVGQEQKPPAAGASEIRQGVLKNDQPYLATIEPWHGDKVVVYTSPADWNPKSTTQQPWQRMVVDDQLAWGHAVACANLDDDPEQELVIGVRDNQSDMHRCGVRVYDPSASSSTATKGTIEWKRTLIDAGGVAVEDLVTADFDGDGRTDILRWVARRTTLSSI